MAFHSIKSNGNDVMNSKYMCISSICVIIIILSCLIQAFMTAPFGIGLSPDSVNYLAASSFIDGQGFLDFKGQAFVSWPPLFPVLLGIIRLVGLDPVNIMPYVQGFFIGATGALCTLFMYWFSRSLILSVCVGLLILISPPLVGVASFLWSEPAYMFLMFSTVLLTIWYLRHQSLPRLVLLGAFCGLAFLQRYAGLSLVVATSLSILLLGNLSVKMKTKHIVIFGIFSCLPVSIWLLRNFLTTNTLTGIRHFEKNLFGTASVTLLSELGTWFVPVRFGDNVAIIVGLVILSTSTLLAVYAIRKNQEKYVLELGVLAVFITIYFVFIVYTLLTACCSDRFLAPLYPVVIVFMAGLVVFLISRFGRLNINFGGKVIAGFAALGIVSVLAINGVRAIALIEKFREQGGGYNSRWWTENSIIEKLKQEPFVGDVCIFSNAPYALAYLLDVQCVGLSPRKGIFYHKSVEIDERPEFVSEIKEINVRVILVWFDNYRERIFFGVESFDEELSVKKLFQTNDGTVYEIKKFAKIQ